MADFRLVSSQIHLAYIDEEETFALDPGCTGELALWGGGPNGEALEIRAEPAGIVEVTKVAAPSRGTDLRSVHLRGAGIGEATLQARLPNGESWATTNVAVGFTPGQMTPALQVPLDGEIPFAIGAARCWSSVWQWTLTRS